MKYNETGKIGYMTIDDAPHNNFIERIDFFESKEIKALWFCNGVRMLDLKDELIYAIKKGHILGNHFYDHVNASSLTLEEIKSQIESTDQLLEQVYELADIKRPFHAFRFPYLNNGDRAKYRHTNWHDEKVKGIQDILKNLGYTLPYCDGVTYQWYKEAGFFDCINMDVTYDSFDWCHNSTHAVAGYESIEAILERVNEDAPDNGRGLNDATSNEIILMHAYTDMAIFKGLTERMLAKGIRFELPVYKK
jgi:peptidoglycan/xylan/chitin deacetylase (PgdA/CDA1 family)